MSNSLKKLLEDSKILCLCEGTSEKGVMNLLLDNDELVFTREQFNLKKVYKENNRIKNKTCLTTPEIEILVIINENALEEYYKVKSKKPPSEFCKQNLKMNDIKKDSSIDKYFNCDSKKLINAIKIYNTKSNGNDYGIYHLIKNS